VKIPDEIVRKAIAKFDAEMPGTNWHECMRAALQVAVDYALEEAAITAEHLNGWSGENVAEHIAAAIRARKDKP
jgi:hypothetical protein